jgi:hypothetical protein
MSSATSTDTAPASTPKAGTDTGFQPGHFFILLSLMAATVAVLLSRQNTPEHLILISLAIGAAGLAASAFYRMLAPLALPAGSGTEPVSDRLREDLEREKALTLRSIKELEFDRAMGKVSQQDFDEMAARLRARAIGIMRQLDSGSGYAPLIEREIAMRLARGPHATAPAARAETSPPVAGLCSCGVRNDSDARFCKACGSTLEAA